MTSALKEDGISVVDIPHSTDDLRLLLGVDYDVVFCMGVIEHIPHSPKGMLESIKSVLKPGGSLILDTPSALYIYNRMRLWNGSSVQAPIAHQFNAPTPFEGHHREYTPDEVTWMLNSVGFHVCETDMFNYSIYGQKEATGFDADFFRQMESSPNHREVIMVRATH